MLWMGPGYGGLKLGFWPEESQGEDSARANTANSCKKQPTYVINKPCVSRDNVCLRLLIYGDSACRLIMGY